MPDVNNNGQIEPRRSDPIIVPTEDVIALHGFSVRDSISVILGIDKAALMNNLLRVSGLLGFGEAILFIIVVSLSGAGAQIACIITGNICLIAGLAMSCGLPQVSIYISRVVIINIMSIASVACAIIAFIALSDVEACVILRNTSHGSHYKYVGHSAYYSDALQCTLGESRAVQESCVCVNKDDDCFAVAFSTNCEPIVRIVPPIVTAGAAISIVKCVSALGAAATLFFFLQAEAETSVEENEIPACRPAVVDDNEERPYATVSTDPDDDDHQPELATAISLPDIEIVEY